MLDARRSNCRLLAAVIAGSLALTGSARAQTTPPSPAAVAGALLAGGARLGHTQLQHPDGGWWALPTDVSDASCINGTGSATTSCANLFGVNGLGLLEAYRHNPQQTSLLSDAVTAGNALVGVFAALDPAARTRPFPQDVEFLGALAQTTGSATYMSVATDWFAVIVAQFPSAASRVDAIIATRQAQGLRTAGAWDAASLVRAARGVGNVDYATAAAARIVEREVDRVEGAVTLPGWKYTDPSTTPSMNDPFGYDLTFLAEGSLLMSLVDLPGFAAKRSEYQTYLLAQQEPAGTWDFGDAQMTADIVKGLIALGDPLAATAIAVAENYFITTQQPGGGWLYYTTEYTYIDSEIMQALAALDNTPAGSNIAAQPSPLAGLQFSTVTTVGTTTVTAIDPSTTGQVPGGYALATLAYEVATTATFSGQITSCFWVPTITDPVAFANVRITHNEGGTLVDRTLLAPDPLAPNFATKTVCARTTSLSPFAVAVFHKKPPVISAPKRLVVEATGPDGAAVAFSVSARDPVDGVVPVSCTAASGDTFPLGDTTVHCTASNTAGEIDSAAFLVRVRDTVGPLIDSVTPSALILPPTGAMVTVTFTVAVHDAADRAPACAIARVASNIKDLDHDGADWAITGPLSVSLEAATRKHKDRTYKIAVTCTDASGNASTEKTAVVVSHLP